MENLPRIEINQETLKTQFNYYATYFKLSETPETRAMNVKAVDCVLDIYNETPERKKELALKHEAEVFGDTE